MKSWLRIVLAGLCVGAVVGPLLSTADATTTPHKKASTSPHKKPSGRPHKKPACAHTKVGSRKEAACAHKKASPHKKSKPHKKGVVGVGDVNPATWMHDLAVNLTDQKLVNIVIPGSHDSGTYALGDDPVSLVGRAQSEDLTSQLNDGIRDFDLRVKYQGKTHPIPPTSRGLRQHRLGDCNDAGYYLVHGVLNACSLSLSGMLDQIAHWAYSPGHEQEIILVNLSIDQTWAGGVAAFPTQECQDFANALGPALLTPNELKNAYGMTDPGQVRLGQLWSMPGHPHVILDNDQCMDTGDASAGQWAPDPPFGEGGGQSYYADQCYADPYDGQHFDNLPGIEAMVLWAAQTRATQGGGDADGHEMNIGPPMVGGLWTLFIQATPNSFDCLRSLADFDLAEQEKVLAALYQEWQTDPTIKANVNIVSGDFVQSSALVKDVIAMDQSKFPIADSIESAGSHQLSTEENGDFGYQPFSAEVTYKGQPVDGVPVSYKISPFDGDHGLHFWQDDGDTVVTTSYDDGFVGFPYQHAVLAGDTSGTWTLTASARGDSTPVTWTLTVLKPPTKVITLQPGGTPGTVQAGSTVDWPPFTVYAIDQHGNGVQDVPYTFDANGVGTFGTEPIFSDTTGPDGEGAVAGFTAGTHAGTWSISVHSPDAVNTVSDPITITPGPLAVMSAAGGDGQQTGVGQLFPEPLAVTVTDEWHNSISKIPVTFKVTSGDATFGSVNLLRAGERTRKPAVLHRSDPPQDSVTVPTDDNGVATAPVLTAGPSAGPIVVTASAGVAPAVKQAVFHLSAVKVAPTAPAISGLTNGDGQVGVAFSGATNGTAPITSYEVRAFDNLHPTAPPVTATGPSSPVTVKGLHNGDPYVFTVSATSADGTSPQSKLSDAINVGVAPVVVSGPANGTVGVPYSSRFAITGAPPANVTLVSGEIPSGLTLGSDGTLTGTPTQAGSYEFTVQASNPVGVYDASVTVAISSVTRGAAPPMSGGRRMRTTICTARAGHKPACAVRTLIGTFPPLGAGAAATLERGTVTYAAGRASAHYGTLTLSRRREIPAGSYTLILRRGHHAIFVAVTVR